MTDIEFIKFRTFLSLLTKKNYELFLQKHPEYDYEIVDGWATMEGPDGIIFPVVNNKILNYGIKYDRMKLAKELLNLLNLNFVVKCTVTEFGPCILETKDDLILVLSIIEHP